jgi:H+/Cl- antiporter ClcA
LFIFELSAPNPFWKFDLLWKTFISCSSAVFSLAIIEAAIHGKIDNWTASALKFGKIRVVDITPSDVIPGAIVLGLVSGCLGAFFINVNTRVNAIRAKLWTKKWQKPIDTFIFSFLTATCFYWFPYWFQTCVPRTVLQDNLAMELELSLDQVLDSEEEQSVYRGWCRDPDTFNPIASIFWQTEGGLIRDILSESVMCSLGQMVVFCAVWYFWTIVTYGTQVPSGLFLPGMIIGCALGEIYAHIMLDAGVFDMEHYLQYRVIYIILGMGACLAGYTRMTYSLAVIVMETSQAINIFLPIILAVGVANQTGSLFTRGLYDRAVRAKQMPILKYTHVPEENRLIRAENIMSKKVVSLRSVETVKNIFTALKTPHHAFPVTNTSGQVIGLIPKNFLVVMIQRRVYYSHPDQKYFVIDGHLKKFLKENLVDRKEQEFAAGPGGHDESYVSQKMAKSLKSWNKNDPNQQELEMKAVGKERSHTFGKVKDKLKKQLTGSQNVSSQQFVQGVASHGGLVDHHDVQPNMVNTTNDSSEMSLYIDKPFNLKAYYDFDCFPESTGFQILDWRLFCRPFDSLDLKLTPEVQQICGTHLEKLIDLRPYMIENPETCNKFDFLPKILMRF